MKHDHDQYIDAWLDKLDAIVTGDNLPSENNDELLHLATRLSTAFAPLREKGRTAGVRHQRLRSQWRARQAKVAYKPAHRRLPRSSLLVATVLVTILVLGMISAGRWETILSNAAHVWHTSSSLDQLQGISIASLSRPHAGLKPLPLLPAVLPSDTQASAYGVITDTANPNILTTFVADYKIAGQEVLLYEQPSDMLFASSTAKTLHIGTNAGQVFQDDRGNTALQWYQHGMLCQITSKLSFERLVGLASVFQPIKSWDLLL